MTWVWSKSCVDLPNNKWRNWTLFIKPQNKRSYFESGFYMVRICLRWPTYYWASWIVYSSIKYFMCSKNIISSCVHEEVEKQKGPLHIKWCRNFRELKLKIGGILVYGNSLQKHACGSLIHKLNLHKWKCAWFS